MYKIVELDERDFAHFKGKIIQIIDSTKRGVKMVDKDYNGNAYTYTSYIWVLTCLVEVE